MKLVYILLGYLYPAHPSRSCSDTHHLSLLLYLTNVHSFLTGRGGSCIYTRWLNPVPLITHELTTPHSHLTSTPSSQLKDFANYCDPVGASAPRKALGTLCKEAGIRRAFKHRNYAKTANRLEATGLTSNSQTIQPMTEGKTYIKLCCSWYIKLLNDDNIYNQWDRDMYKDINMIKITLEISKAVKEISQLQYVISHIFLNSSKDIFH